MDRQFNFIVLLQLVMIVSITGCSNNSDLSCSDIKRKYFDYQNMEGDAEVKDVLSKINSHPLKYKNCRYQHLLVGDLYYRLGYLELAEKSYLKNINEDTSDVYTAFKLANLYAEQNRYKLALLLYNKIEHQLAPNDLVIEYTDDFYAITETQKPETRNFNITYSEVVLNDVVTRYNANYLTSAKRGTEYLISSKINLGFAYYLRALINIKLGENENVCNDMKLAFENGNRSISDSFAKYCPGKQLFSQIRLK